MSASEPLAVLHVDNHLLVVVKPAGTPTVPDASGDESLLERAREWVRVRFDKPGNVFLGVVQRLDRPVSGVLCFARTSKAARRLTESFRARRPEKLYWGVSDRPPRDEQGVLVQRLAKDRERNLVRELPPGSGGGAEAVTRWRLLRAQGGLYLLELVPETGRPHQLRVAARALGSPLLGDLKYGAREPLPDASVALHARALALDHPTRAERLRFVAEPPSGPAWEPWSG